MSASDKRLAGKTAIVTGSSRGIGRGIATRFAQEGANVVINYVGAVGRPRKRSPMSTPWLRPR